MAQDARTTRGRLDDYLMRRRTVLKAGLGSAALLAAPGLARRAFAAPAEPLHFIGWQYNPQIVAENVDIFKKLYDENVTYELVPGEYHAIAETKMIAGQHIDMMYSEEDHLVRWHRAGWIRDIEGLPGVRRSRPACTRSTSATCRCRTASSAACPTTRASTPSSATRSTSTKAKLEAPASWDELLDQCRKLKKDGIAEHPYISAWQQQWASLSWSLFSVWYSEGAKVFDDKYDPVFDDAVPQGAGAAPHPLQGGAGRCPTSSPCRRRRAELRQRRAHLHGRPRVRPEGAQRPDALADRRRRARTRSCRAPPGRPSSGPRSI